MLGAARRLLALLLRLPRWLYAVASAAWMFLSWSLSNVGQDDSQWLVKVPSFWINFAHAVVFGALALWLTLTLPRSRTGSPRPLVTPGRFAFVVTFAVAYGLVDEWHQSWVPGRHPTLLDVLTDAVGASCTVWVLNYLGRPGAREGGFGWRVAVALWLSLGAAWLATWYHTVWPEPLWPGH